MPFIGNDKYKLHQLIMQGNIAGKRSDNIKKSSWLKEFEGMVRIFYHFALYGGGF